MVKFKLFGVEIDVSVDNNGDEEDQTHHHQSEELGVPLYNPTPLQFCLPHALRIKKRKRKHNCKSRAPPAIPRRLLQHIGPAADPIFLYRKKLGDSDVEKAQNGLLVIRREGFDKFLNEDECAILNDGGLEEIVGVDVQGNLYNLRLNIWSLMNVMVVNSEWNKLVKQNDAREGDVVQIWGHREMGKLCFAFNFKKKAC